MCGRTVLSDEAGDAADRGKVHLCRVNIWGEGGDFLLLWLLLLGFTFGFRFGSHGQYAKLLVNDSPCPPPRGWDGKSTSVPELHYYLLYYCLLYRTPRRVTC